MTEQQFPIKATHKNFGEISITGIRTESNSNNNTMYQFRLNGELVWGYDYEITILSPLPHQDGASAEDGMRKAFYSALKYCNDLPIKNMKLFKDLSFEMMKEFAKSESAKVVAEKDKYIRQVQTGMQSVINMKDAEIEAHKREYFKMEQLQKVGCAKSERLESDLSASNAHRTRLIEAIRKWIKAWRKDQQEIRRIKSELSKANERVKELEERLNKFDTMRTDTTFINNVCLSYNHSFGLMGEHDKHIIQFECAEWMRAILNNIEYKKQ